MSPASVPANPGPLMRLRMALYRRRRALAEFPANWKRERALARLGQREIPLLAEARRKHEAEYASFNNPLVSVVINTYSRGQLLAERTLPAVFEQTHQNLEVVVVGDCCPDDTPERMAQIKDPRLRFHNLPERGKYPDNPQERWFVAGTAPANHALRIAKGQWIAHLDDDDVLTPTYLEDMLKRAYETDAELVYAQSHFEATPGVWRMDGSPNFPSGRWPHRGEAIAHSAVMFRSYLRFFEYDINAYKYKRAGDMWLWFRMKRAGVRTAMLSKIGVLRPLRPDQIPQFQAAPAAMAS